MQAASYDFLSMEKLIEVGLLMVGSLQWAVGEISWQFAVGSWQAVPLANGSSWRDHVNRDALLNS